MMIERFPEKYRRRKRSFLLLYFSGFYKQ